MWNKKKNQQKLDNKSSSFFSTCANSHSDSSSTVQHSRPEIRLFRLFSPKPAGKNFHTKIVKDNVWLTVATQVRIKIAQTFPNSA